MYGSSKFVTQEMTGAIIPALMHRIPSELRRDDGCDHTSTNAPDPIRTPQLKRAWARVVLGWVTSWEVLVLHPYFWFGNGRFSDIGDDGCDHTSTNAPDPIRTPQLSVLGRE
ncbi:hypothetical protein V6N13_048612 [Hibiscus sabdariffa]